MIEFHWGDPKHPTEIRAWTGTTSVQPSGQPRKDTFHSIAHRIGRWYGLSVAHKWFLGFWFFEKTYQDRNETVPVSMNPAERELWEKQ